MSEAIRELLTSIKRIPKGAIVAERLEKNLEEKQILMQAQEKTIAKKRESLAVLKGEIANSLTGKSSFSPELLNEQILSTEAEIAEALRELSELELSFNDCNAEKERLEAKHTQLVSYGEMFDCCDLDEKRMIICGLVSEIRVSRGYQIELKLNVSLQRYLDHVDPIVLERDDFVVGIARDATPVDFSELDGLNTHEAVMRVIEDRSGIDYEDARALLEIPNTDLMNQTRKEVVLA